MATASVSGHLQDRLRASLPGRVVVLYLVVGWIAIGIYFLIPGTAQDYLYLVIGVSAVAAIALGSQRLGAGRLAWRLFAFGLLCEVGGDGVSTYYELVRHHEAPVPSLADAFYLAGYPLLALGIFLLLRELGGTTLRAGVLDTVI